MTIKLNEYDKRLLSQITPASKWDKLKSIYAINSVIKQLKIGNKKIGLKCAKHLQKLSKQNTTSIQEIREGCRDLKIPKQKLPLAKDKTKREVESVHKINKATDKAPTDKTTGGSGGGGRKGGGGGGGGKAQPQADLVGGLFTAFKAQEAKQARDNQFNLLSSEMNRDINLNLARTEQRARQEAGLGRAFGSQDTSLQALKTALFTQREAKELGERNVPSLTSAENRVLDALIKDKRPNPLDLLQVNPEQDLTNVSIPSTPRTVSSVSSLSDISSLSSSSMFNPTQEEKNKLAMQLLDEREKNLSSVQASVKRKQEMLKEKVAEADIYAEQQRQSMIQNKIGIQTENYINREREEIKSNVLNKNMNHKEAQKKLQQLNTFYLKQLDYEQQQRVNKNIFDDIEQIERDRQFRLRNRKVGVDSVLSRLRNRESQEKQDRLVNDLIINQNEKKIEDLQSELLGVVSSRAMQKQKGKEETLGNLQLGVMDRVSGLAEKKENRQEQIDLLRARMRNQNVVEQENQGFIFNPPTNPDLSSIQQNVLSNVGDRVIQRGIEQENILGNLQLGVMDRTSGLAEQQAIFNQSSQPQLGLTRTQSGEKIKQSDLQRTLSAPAVQALDIGRAERKLKEQQESEALFNKKQQELASEIQDLQRTQSLIERMEADAMRSLSEISAEEFALPIQKKESPRDDESPPSELPSEEMLENMYKTDYTQEQIEEMEFLKKKKDEEDYEYFEEHYTQGTDEAGDAINDLKNNLNQYKNTGNIKSNFLEEDDEEFIKTKNELKKLKPQELDKLIQLTDKLDNDLGYEPGGSYKDYGKKQYANAVKSKNELYDYAKSININIDTLHFEGNETIDENLPVFSDSD